MDSRQMTNNNQQSTTEQLSVIETTLLINVSGGIDESGIGQLAEACSSGPIGKWRDTSYCGA